MTSLGPNPVQRDIDRALAGLQAGTESAATLETTHLDLKEDPSRRQPGGTLGPAEPRNEAAARYLAGESACMANTPGGGALIVGVADDGTLTGTALEADWLRHRIYELTESQLTTDVEAITLDGHRLLIIRALEAVAPIRSGGRLRWRVADHCVEIDATTWHERRFTDTSYDWSRRESGYPATAARATAMETARTFLQASGEPHAGELADLDDHELLNRLGAVTADGKLTNAAAITFIGRPEPSLDYIRRDHPGADSTNRIREGNRGLIEELDEIERAIRATNPIQHVPSGLVTGQRRLLPEGAVRETIVNGCVHRDWATTQPTVIEHEGANLVVTSPGGFVGGVNPSNIITHPSQPRNRALAELFAHLRVAEQEGVGVDRIVREMISAGHPRPSIAESDGPHVRAALVAETTDAGWIRFLARIQPATARRELNTLMLLRALIDRWWIDVAYAAPVLQRSEDETAGAIRRLADLYVYDFPLIQEVDGVPAGSPPAWRISSPALTALQHADTEAAYTRMQVTRTAVAASWAAHRRRISTTELASIVGASASNVGGVLRALERQGVLRPGRENRRGAGFFYEPN